MQSDDEKVNTAERRTFAPAKAMAVAQAIAHADGADHNFDEAEHVKMVFPRHVRLVLPGYKVVDFKQGVQMVPAELVDHPYLVAHGVKPYVPKQAAAAPAPQQQQEEPPKQLSEEERKAAEEAAARKAELLKLGDPEQLAKPACTKAQIVEIGKKFGLELDESSKKDELIQAIVEATAKL